MVKKNIGSYLKLLAVSGLAIFLVHVSSVNASNSVKQDGAITTE